MTDANKGGIRTDKDHQVKLGNTTPLIDDLEMQEIFKDKNREEGNGVTDLINGLVELLSLETQVVWYAVQKAFDLIKPWDEE